MSDVTDEVWNESPPPELTQLLEDERARLALRIAVELLAGEKIPEDDQKRVARYVGESGPEENPYPIDAGISRERLGSTVAAMLSMGEVGVGSALDLLAKQLADLQGNIEPDMPATVLGVLDVLGFAYSLVTAGSEHRRAFWASLESVEGRARRTFAQEPVSKSNGGVG